MTPSRATRGKESQRDWPETRRAIYAQLLEDGLDEDALHQLLIERGPELLDASIPYLVVAARNRSISTVRRDHRRVELEEERSSFEAHSGPLAIDPADAVIAHNELAAVVRALGQMDPKLSWPLWWHAAGYTDQEISELWNDAGFLPRDPSSASVRKRRERARRQLRGLVE